MVSGGGEACEGLAPIAYHYTTKIPFPVPGLAITLTTTLSASGRSRSRAYRGWKVAPMV